MFYGQVVFRWTAVPGTFWQRFKSFAVNVQNWWRLYIVFFPKHFFTAFPYACRFQFWQASRAVSARKPKTFQSMSKLINRKYSSRETDFTRKEILRTYNAVSTSACRKFDKKAEKLTFSVRKWQKLSFFPKEILSSHGSNRQVKCSSDKLAENFYTKSHQFFRQCPKMVRKI